MTQTSSTPPRGRALPLLSFLAFGFSCLYGWLVNGSLFVAVATFAPFARDTVMILSAVLFALLAIAANRFPHVLERRQMTLVSLGCLASAAIIIPLALQIQSTPFTLAGLGLFTLGGVWPITTVLAAIVSLPTQKDRTLVIAGAVVASAFVRVFISLPPAIPGLMLLVIGQAATLFALGRPAATVLDRITKGAPASNLLVEKPAAFLQPTHALFPCILLFYVASSYGSIFSEGSAQTYFGFSAVVLTAAFCWSMFSTNRYREDVLFSASVLLAVAGFMTVPFSAQLNYPLPGALLDSSGSCFTILYWLVIVAIGTRNHYALIPTFALANCMNYIGVEIGASAGHTSLAALDTQAAGMIALVAGFIFVAFLWLFFRKFSFSETIRGVSAITPVIVSAPEGAQDLACEQLATKHGLTEREREIFAMMAKGRNTRFIQEQLVISPNTVRSHIKHIYQKLDVHSQQELIDLVETKGRKEDQ